MADTTFWYVAVDMTGIAAAILVMYAVNFFFPRSENDRMVDAQVET